MRAARTPRHCVCADTGWVCEVHPDKPWNGPNACDCGGAGMPCLACNPCGGPDEPPNMARAGFKVKLDGSRR
jgi:hypothetical protein